MNKNKIRLFRFSTNEAVKQNKMEGISINFRVEYYSILFLQHS